jgi:hypothetical protein
MTYIEFRDLIQGALKEGSEGMTWAELRDSLVLPYKQPCYTWLVRLENEIGLRRRRTGRRMIWTCETSRSRE